VAWGGVYAKTGFLGKSIFQKKVVFSKKDSRNPSDAIFYIASVSEGIAYPLCWKQFAEEM
jgi:hypothetical protein